MLCRAFLVFLSDFDAITEVPKALPFKMSLTQKENTVNLKRAPFVVIMLLHEGSTHIHSQIKPGLHFGESFTSHITPAKHQHFCIAHCVC